MTTESSEREGRAAAEIIGDVETSTHRQIGALAGAANFSAPARHRSRRRFPRMKPRARRACIIRPASDGRVSVEAA
jgi:hypothetical protein